MNTKYIAKVKKELPFHHISKLFLSLSVSFRLSVVLPLFLSLVFLCMFQTNILHAIFILLFSCNMKVSKMIRETPTLFEPYLQHKSASIIINQHQSESISVNQNQSASITISRHQSAYQSASKAFVIDLATIHTGIHAQKF